ncbi:hypothetical protein ISCGN_010194 [Ixodes scapularis]
MADAPLSAAADAAHLSSAGSWGDEDMETRQTQDASPAEKENDENTEPWITVTKRARRRGQQPRSTTPPLPLPPLKPALHQSRPKVRKPRPPPLPADDFKLAIRPRNGLQLNKVSPGKLVDAIALAAQLQIGATEFKVRLDADQNILVLSTPSQATASALSKVQKLIIDETTYDIASYGVAPDNSCKGVIYNIAHDTTPEMVLQRIAAPGYEALTCRRLGNTTTMVITFLGKRVPYYIELSGFLIRCYLYKRTVPHCRTCHEIGHRADVCPRPPVTPKCRECGAPLTTEQHDCHPRCSLCGGNHPTATKPCPKRFLSPVNRRKPQQHLGNPPQSPRRVSSPSPGSNGWRSASRQSRSPTQRGGVRGRSASRHRPGSRRRTPSRNRQPSRSRTPGRGRSASARRGGQGAAQATQQVSWAQVVSPEARPPPTPQVSAELAQAHASIACLKEENATLRAEITQVHAELAALRDKLLGRTRDIPAQNTQNPPPEKRKRAEKPEPTDSPNSTPQRAPAQPNTLPGLPHAQHTTSQQIEEIVARAIQSLHTSLQVTLNQQLTAIKQTAAQQQLFNTQMEERVAKLEERLPTLDARRNRRQKETTHPDQPEPHMLQELPPSHNLDGCYSTSRQ